MILLVPEQATFQVERALVNTPDLPGFMRVHVLSFKRLAGRLLQELGGGARREIGELGKLMVLRSLVLERSNELSILAAGARRYGLAECLAGALKELTMYGVGPADLEAGAAKLEREGRGATALALKLRDLALIARAYREYLGERFQDPDDHLSVAAEKVSRSSLTRGSLVWVDGFRDFTPQQYSILEALLPVASRVSVALCLDPKTMGRPTHDTELFLPTLETHRKLTELARRLSVEIEDPVILSDSDSCGGSVSYRGPGIAVSCDVKTLCGNEIGAQRAAAPGSSAPHSGAGTSECHQPGTGKRSAPLQHLEREFGTRRPSPFDGEPDGVRLVAAANPRAEVQAAAREILRLVREEGMRFRDIGVIVAGLETYHDLIQPIFRDHGIPFFIDRRRPVGHHPLVELIRSALDVVCDGWSYDSVFRYLKTDLVPVSRHEVDLLENYVLARGIRGKRWLDPRPWKYRRAPGLETPGDAEDDVSPCPEDEEMTRLIDESRLKATSALRAFHGKVAGDSGRGRGEEQAAANVGVGEARRVRDMARALFELLTDLGVRARLEQWTKEAAESGDVEAAREHQQVWNAVIGLLDEAVEALGEQAVDAPAFRELIEAGLEGMTLGLIPPALDQVIVGSVERSRHSGLRAAFVIGATYDAFPRRVSEETMFSDYERERLGDKGLILAPSSRVAQFHEQYNVYVALTRARERLWVSYPMADGEGRAIRPSPVRAQLKAMFPKLVEEFASDELPSSPQEVLDAITSIKSDERAAASEERAAAMIVRHFRTPLAPPVSGDACTAAGGAAGCGDDFWLDLYEWLVEDPDRRARALNVLRSLSFTNHVEKLDASTARALYPDSMWTSVSRLEAFARCPFAHFAGNVLGLTERELFKLEPPGMGTFIHEALRRLVDGLGDERGLADMSDNEIEARVGQIVEKLAPSLQDEILRSSARYRYIERVLTRILKRSAMVLREHARRSEFRSIRRELVFGRDGDGDGRHTIPCLAIDVGDGRRVSLAGRIDRVDLAKTEGASYLRVIDYKSGQRSFDLSDVYYGLALQLLVYLAVIEEHSTRLADVPAEPAGAFYFPTVDPIISAPEPLDHEALEKKRRRKLRMAGLIVGDAYVVRLMDAEVQGVSDIVTARLTRDGEVAKGSRNSVIDRDKYRVLREFLLAKVRELSSRIMSGEVSPRPYRRGKLRACQRCSFKPVCGFDVLVPGNEYRAVIRLKDDEFWAAVESGLSGGTMS
jgi:ATP-dependent helicase/nuclease subunit B